jgi:hypothetical protein
MSLHSFDPDVAKKVGVNAAVIYQNILFWTEKNFRNERNIHDGFVWTYNSVKAWAELFPYLTPKQIRSALQKLESEGFIASGNYNKSAYDRTKWYGVSTCRFGQIDLPVGANEVAQRGEPIPDSKPDNKPDNKHIAHSKRDRFDEFWSEVPRKIGKGQARKAWTAALKKADADTIITGIRRYAAERRSEDPKFTAHPATWLNGERWEDERPKPKPRKKENWELHYGL